MKNLIVGSIIVVIVLSFSNVVVTKNVQGSSYSCMHYGPDVSGTLGDNGWYVSSVVVTFNDSLHSIDYRIDGGNWINYTGPFSLSTEGIHLLEWTYDSHMSNVSSITIKIDRTPPLVTQAYAKRVGLLKWQIIINATDNISGVNRVLDGITNTIDTEPPYQFTFR